MWKLTITQKRKSEYSDYKDTHKVEFVRHSSKELLAVAGELMNCETNDETSFSIEKMQKGEGEE